MNPKEFYSNYQADDTFSELSSQLVKEVLKFSPNHVFEMGCGTGKNLKPFNERNIPTIGLDISMINIINAKVKNELPCVICADESYLRNLVNFDVVFTVSVLDHIEDIEGIIQEFKRMANKAVIIAETNDVADDFYYPHDYESYGFVKSDYKWRSNADGANYFIWILDKTLCVEYQVQ